MPLQHETLQFRGLPCIRLRDDGASALVSLRGAQLLSWIPQDGRERLFLAGHADLASGAAVRGGIPIIFPQFAERGLLRRHGFARQLDWSFAGIADGSALFELRDSAATAEWPHAFACRLSITPGPSRLEVALEVENLGSDAFAFTAALHSYLRVDDIARAALEGLQGCDYEDSANGGTLHRQDAHAVTFDGELDRIYADVVAPLRLVDGDGHLDIEHEGFGDAIVWNPGETLAAGLPDLAPGEYRRFVCVEAGQVLQPVLLAPGQRWRGRQLLG